MQKVTMQKQMKGSTDFSAISQASSFSAFVRKQSEYLLEQLTQAKMVSDQKREVLKNAMQKVDALEKLKETQKEDFNAEEKRKTAKLLGQIVTVKYARDGKEKE